MKRYCFALDLKDDPELIAAYVNYHKNVWPEILESIKESGIKDAEIYLVQNRLFMIIEAFETFSLDNKAAMDLKNETVQQWENLMWSYQEALPGSKPGEKWKRMDCIFKL